MLLLLLLSTAAASERVALEYKPVEIARWRKLGEPAPTDPKRLVLALKQKNVKLLTQVALNVSTPSHPAYGQHMTADDVAELVAPPAGALDAVLAWLEDTGVPRSALAITKAADFVVCDTDVAAAERLQARMDTRMGTWAWAWAWARAWAWAWAWT